MAAYLVLNCIFLLTLLLLCPKIKTPSFAWWLMLAVLLVLTAVFDSLIIYFDIVGYDTAKLLGVYIGKAPIEDFFYALYAAAIVPLLWQKFDRQKRRPE